MLEEGALLHIHDPKVTKKQIAFDLGSEPNPELITTNKQKRDLVSSWNFISDIGQCFVNADAVVILTEWEEYTKIDWEMASIKMRKPSWIFDSRSVIEPNEMIKLGINFWRIGYGLS